MIIFLAMCWYLSGVSSFVYWWTTEYDLTFEDLCGAFLIGMIGPFAFVLGFAIHSKKGKTVIIKNRSDFRLPPK